MLNKIKLILNKFIVDIDVLFVGLFLLACDLFVKKYCGMGISKQSLIITIIYILVLSNILLLFNNKIRFIFEIVMSIIMTIYSFSQVIHFNFFSTFYRLKKMKVIYELKNVMDETLSKIDIKSLSIFLFLCILLIVLFIWFKKINSNRLKERLYTIMVYLCLAVMFGLILVLGNKKKNNTDDDYLRSTFYNNAKYINRFGVYDYLVNDTLSIFNKSGELSDEKKQEIDNFLKENDNIYVNNYTNLFKDKNLILIECESLNNYPFIEELTPTLTKLSKEGYYFTNFYSPLYESATSDAEFISLTSMLPSINEGQTCYTYPNNNYKYSLPNLFKNIGYDVNSYHANYVRFYNRDAFHKALGFNEFYDLEKLEIKQLDSYEEDLNWVPDTLLFDSVIEHTNTNSKFFDFVTTVSGHMPYVDYREEIKDDLAIINSSDKYNYMNDETKAYVACQMSLDKGLEILLDKLEEKGVLEDTIIILFGDHYPYGLVDLDAQYTVYGTGVEKYKTPLIIYDPTNKEGKTIDTLVSSFDIYPTICNLFGLDSSGGYKIGKDAFEDDHIVIFADRSILTKNYYYDSTSGNVEWFIDENNSLLEKDKQDINDIFDKGELILIYDFYNK